METIYVFTHVLWSVNRYGRMSYVFHGASNGAHEIYKYLNDNMLHSTELGKVLSERGERSPDSWFSSRLHKKRTPDGFLFSR